MKPFSFGLIWMATQFGVCQFVQVVEPAVDPEVMFVGF